MTARSPALYLSEILSSMDKIERYVAGLSYDEFILREQTVDAVERNIEKMVKLPRRSRIRSGNGILKYPGKRS
jgi:hypothetical protein